MNVLRWPTKMPEGGLLPHGKSTYERNKGKVTDPLGACEQTIHISLFFDGTNNNDDEDNEEFRDSKWLTHTNVARLYTAAHDKPESGIFKHYIAGVGTIFKKLGEYEYSSAGKAFAWGYNRRCAWAYTRVLNSIYKAIADEGQDKDDDQLIRDDEAKALSEAAAEGYRAFSALFDAKHRRLAGKQQARARDCQRNKMVKRVWINVFGFSRGAAAARSFVGKLTRDWAPNGKIAGEIDYKINFMGLFDTVASVGPPDSVRAAFDFDAFDGHYTWANDGLINIPRQVNFCAHFFSIHEQRMSFPLDTIREGDAYPGGAGQRMEVAYPGVHSDVGGGYAPGDQGKARSGEGDKLSQIPLHHMYIEALSWGVPLMSEEEIIRIQGEQHDFLLGKPVIDAFNAWLGKMGSISRVEDAMRIGMRHSLAWRTLRARWQAGSYVTNQAFFKAAPEDTLTPYQLAQRVDEAAKADPETLELRKQLQALNARRPFSNTGAHDNQLSAAELAALMKQLQAQRQQTQDIQTALTRRREQLCQALARKQDKTRPGEGADETVTNDQHDLLEAAEEFRLLLGVLHPALQTGLGVETSSFTLRPPALGADIIRPLGIPLAMFQTSGHLPCVRRERNPDSAQVLLAVRDWYVQTAAAMADFSPQKYDVLVVPAQNIVEKLRKWTAPDVVDKFSHQERPIVALFDDYIHDSRAWFRVPHFHEYAPGGYGWARVLFVGNHKRVRFLGFDDDARREGQKAATAALLKSANTAPRPSIDEMLLGD